MLEVKRENKQSSEDYHSPVCLNRVHPNADENLDKQPCEPDCSKSIL